MSTKLTGAEIIVRTLLDLEVDTIFGYPGGAILPFYDALFTQNQLRHILTRHEQAAAHAAEGYARSTGKVGVITVTSGPGATNTITGLTDAYLDSIPLVCISGQVATPIIGTDGFQEADITGLTRSCTKHNYLVKDVNDLENIIHEAFYIATSGRPGPVLIDVPKDVQNNRTEYRKKTNVRYATSDYKENQHSKKLTKQHIIDACDLIVAAKRPLFYIGGGVINSGKKASELLQELVTLTGYPLTSTLMGLGAFPASDRHFIGMVGMHGTYEANLAMHDCDLMINVGARFDDRVTGRVDKFSPHSKKIHIDIDESSINKIIRVDVELISDAGLALEKIIEELKRRNFKTPKAQTEQWWKQMDAWKKIDSLGYEKNPDVIKPVHAMESFYELSKKFTPIISTDVGQHQMWAAQYIKFEQPRKWLTSGGLGTMGYGVPAAIGAQVAHPDKLVVCVSGDASFLMNMQELSTIKQYNLPVKILILNNRYMGMVRQWQELIYESRESHSYMDSLPDFVKLAESFGIKGIRCDHPSKLDAAITEMLNHPGPVLFDCMVEKSDNVFPMIPAGAAHNEILLSKQVKEYVQPDKNAV